MKPTVSPKALKTALKVAAVVIAIAAAVATKWEAGTITDTQQFLAALVQSISDALSHDEQP